MAYSKIFRALHPGRAVHLAGVILGVLFPGAAVATIPPPPPAPEIRAPLSDEAFFAKFDLNLGGMEGVRDAVEAGDFGTARAALARYFRAREGVFHPFDPTELPPVEARERVVRHSRPLVGRSGDFAPAYWTAEGLYDYEASPIRFKERMYYLDAFARAAVLEGGEEIAASLVVLLRSFIHGYHAAEAEGRRMWLTMNTGIRLRTGWPTAFLALLHSPHFTDDDLVLFLQSVWDQTNHLRHNHSETSNWLTFEMAGLYTSGIVYPEFKDAAEWRRVATEVAVADIGRGWLPDGMTIELSPAYGQYFSNYFIIHDLARHVGRFEEFGIAELVARTEPIYAAYVKIMAPDRFAPATNNNRPANVSAILRAGLERFPSREDFRWAVTDGAEGTAPDFTSAVLPYAGFAAMRSGWGREDHLFYFDFGPIGYRHAHQDGLNVMLWAYGRQVLFDPGLVGYDYDDPMVNYAIDTFSHNTVIVDRRPQRRPWYDNPHPKRMPYSEVENYRWESNERYDFAAGVYDQAFGPPGGNMAYPYSPGSDFREGWGHPARHHRRVYFHKPDLFLVADTLLPNDGEGHEYDLRWHLDSVSIGPGQVAMSIVTRDDGVPNLEIVPLLTDRLTVRTTSAQREPEILGWNVADSENPRPATTLQHVKIGAGPVRFFTVLLPLRPGEAFRLAAAERGEDGAFHLSLADGRRFSIFLPEDVWEAPVVESILD